MSDTHNKDDLTTVVGADISGFQREFNKLDPIAKKTVSDMLATATKGAKQHEDTWAATAGHINKSFGKINIGESIAKGITGPLKGAAEEGASALGPLGGSLEALGVAGLAAGVGLAAVAGAVELAMKGFERDDLIEDTSKKLGITTDQFQAYGFAAKEAGVSQEAFADAIKGGNAALGAFQTGVGDGKIKKVFDALGITREQAQQFDNIGDALPMLADKIKALGSTAEQTKFAKALGIEDLLPLLQDGSARIAELTKEAKDSGFVIDESIIKRGAEANKKLEKMKDLIGIQLQTAFVDLAPVIEAVVGAVAGLAHAIGNVADSFRDLDHKSTEGLTKQRDKLQKELDAGAPMDVADEARWRDAHQSSINVINAQLNGRTAEDEGAKKADAAKLRADAAAAGKEKADADAKAAAAKADAAAKAAAEVAKANADALAEAHKREIAAVLLLTADLQDQHEGRLAAIEADRAAQIQKVKEDTKLTGAISTYDKDGNLLKAGAGNKGTVEASINLEASAKTQKEIQDNLDRKAKDASDDAARVRTIQAQILNSLAGSAKTAQDSYDAELAAFHLQQANDLQAEKDREEARLRAGDGYTAQSAAIDRALFNAKQQAELDAETLRLKGEYLDRLQQQVDAAYDHASTIAGLHGQLSNTAAGRNAYEKQAFDAGQAKDLSDAQNTLNKAAPGSADAGNAAKALSDLKEVQALQAQVFAKQHEDPWQQYLDGLQDVQTELGNMKVSLAQDLTNDIIGLANHTKKLGDVFRDLASSIISDLIRIGIEKSILAATGLSDGAGGGSGGGASSVGTIISIAKTAASIFGFATGTDGAPGGLSLVGEQGPELVNMTPGAQVFSNGELRKLSDNLANGGGRGAVTQNLTVHQHVSADGLVQSGDVISWIAHANQMTLKIASEQIPKKMSFDQSRRLR